MTFRLGILQLSAGDDPQANLDVTSVLVRKAAAEGANLVVTPEVTNAVIRGRDRAEKILCTEAEDLTLRALRNLSNELKIWILIGSLGLKNGKGERFSNRSFLISSNGEIAATYDKIHMFDAQISANEAYRESQSYRPGNRAVLGDMNGTRIGMTICYDLRFAHLYADLAKAGAQIITAPSAFTRQTGQAHFEVLLRARAIETGCFILAPCQTGQHIQQDGTLRETYGHSMVINPWGAVLCDLGTEIGYAVLDIDLDECETARNRIPSLSGHRTYQGPSNAQ